MPIHTVMYHYVRNNENFEYNTFSRRISEYEKQIDFFINNSTILDPNNREQILYYLNSKSKYAFLLTFDDGYLDHLHCAEYLFFKKQKGLFFPSQLSINNQMLDVNKIHLILGCKNFSTQKILSILREFINERDLEIIYEDKKITMEDYISLVSPSRYNHGENLIIKRLLQRDIANKKERSNLIDKLLYKIYKSKNIKFDYLTIEDLNNIKEMGMSIGSHSNSHRWLNSLSFQEQNLEIKNSIEFLQKLNLIRQNDMKFFCYPYGAFNQDTLNILNKYNVDFAFTVSNGESLIDNSLNDSYLKLKRWDTNDFWDSKYKKVRMPKF